MIIGIEGDISAGKTLVMTKCIFEEWYAFRNRKILANYHLKHVPSQFITFDDFLQMAMDDVELKDVIFGLDELHNWMDARTSSSKMNRAISYLFLQTGKMDVTSYYTTQAFRQIDVRLYERTDIRIHVERSGDSHYCHFADISTGKKGHFLIYGPDVYELYNTKEKVKSRPMKMPTKPRFERIDNEFKGVLVE